MSNLSNLQFLNPSANSSGDPMHEYIDIQVVNNKDTYEPQPIVFNQIKTSNIIDSCQDYYLSVVKWSFNSNIPQIIPRLKLSTSEFPNIPYDALTIYNVNIGKGTTQANAVFVQPTNKYVHFTPENGYLSPPQFQPTAQQLYNNPFFYIYSVENFLKMVNNALEQSFLQAKTTIGGLDDAVAPRFVWNTNTNKLNLIVSKEFVEGLNTNTYYLSMNCPLYNLFDTFPSYCNSLSTALPAQNNFYFSLNDNYGLQTFSDPNGTTGTPLTLYTYSQQSSSVVSWSPVNSLLFTTSLIPVNSEFSGSPEYLGDNLSNTSNSQQNLTAILTDFTIPMVDGTEYSRTMLYYIPTSEYRLIDLLGNSPFNQLNIQVYWKDIIGQLHPATLKLGTNATMKILLRKRSFNGL
jgi:hypothetical protein